MPFKGRAYAPSYMAEVEAVVSETAGIRRFGSAALDLAYVAAGRYEGFWEYALSPWDTAAGSLLVTEAGGFIGEIDGGNNPVFGKSVLAANGELNRPIRDLLARAKGKAANVGTGQKAANG
jgi:myo-inositol-1(or 4)-monophosphatase